MPHPKYAFFEGEIIPIEKARLDIRTHTLQYGTGVFEGIRSYWNEKDRASYLFRLEDHYRRMIVNSRTIMIEIKYSLEELSSTTIQLLKKEGYSEDAYVRPFAYNSGLTIGPKLIGNDQDLFIYSIPLGMYLDTNKAISVCTSSWQRIRDNAIPARAKISGSYINAALQKTEALQNGFDEAIVLTSNGSHVSEGSAMNLFMVRNDTLITPPVTDDILEGITRSTIIKLAEDEGLQVLERSIDRTELYIADELFFCGTGAQVSPIGFVDRRTVRNGEMGPVTKKLQDLYFKVVKNEVEKYSSWCTRV